MFPCTTQIRRSPRPIYCGNQPPILPDAPTRQKPFSTPSTPRPPHERRRPCKRGCFVPTPSGVLRGEGILPLRLAGVPPASLPPTPPKRFHAYTRIRSNAAPAAPGHYLGTGRSVDAWKRRCVRKEAGRALPDPPTPLRGGPPHLRPLHERRFTRPTRPAAISPCRFTAVPLHYPQRDTEDERQTTWSPRPLARMYRDHSQFDGTASRRVHKATGRRVEYDLPKLDVARPGTEGWLGISESREKSQGRRSREQHQQCAGTARRPRPAHSLPDRRRTPTDRSSPGERDRLADPGRHGGTLSDDSAEHNSSY
jgi:hypothetical protein